MKNLNSFMGLKWALDQIRMAVSLQVEIQTNIFFSRSGNCRLLADLYQYRLVEGSKRWVTKKEARGLQKHGEQNHSKETLTLQMDFGRSGKIIAVRTYSCMQRETAI